MMSASGEVVQSPFVEWSPLPSRPPLRWPDEARVAVCVILSLEQLEWYPSGSFQVAPSARYGGPYPQVFDALGASLREYGNRVGIFRLMEVLDRLQVPATVAIDAVLAERNPYLVAECMRRDWELIGHGVVSSRMVSERMSEDDERAYLSRALEAVRQASGRAPLGWLGTDYGESSRTVRLLAELGVRYVCDWPNDEQPYRMKLPGSEMIALPVSAELDDVLTHRLRGIPIGRWAKLACDTFDRLHGDGARSGRLVVLHVHPYLMGQPFRIGWFTEVLEHMLQAGAVWTATGSEIVDWYAYGQPAAGS